MDIPVANKNSLSYFLLSSSIILFLWTLSSLATYTIPYQVAVLLECRWLLASLLVTCFFTYLFVNIRSSVMFTVTYVSAQYCLAYSTVSTIICSINIHHVLINWSEDEQLKLASNSDQAMQKSERKMQMLICSLVHIILGGINLFSCYKFMKNIPFASSFIVQQICCTFSSLLIARMQWQFRDYINTYISRFIVIMNVCQLVQELTYAYSTFMMMMFVNNETNSLLLRFSSGLKNQVSSSCNRVYLKIF
ncbi:unnamed protein product [Thelazia callipaeda]|uniref:7TM GPCR serpentine receptor class x (Srx) domain-containing protein n=1 Tax=Thelazia callipaeda TaxID=103827 RepID=A0A0N5CSN8_THECL|nr:unnamed protein product [Thelazia callipaeda]